MTESDQFHKLPDKFCKDCWHCNQNPLYAAICSHPKSNYITGAENYAATGDAADLPRSVYRYCDNMRRYECGIEGKYWAPKNQPPTTQSQPRPRCKYWQQAIVGFINHPWVIPPLVGSALWLMWWVAAQFTN